MARSWRLDGEISIGTYIAYMGLVVWLIWPIRNLGRIIVSTSTGMVSYARLMEVVKQQREPLLRWAAPARGRGTRRSALRGCLVHVFRWQIGCAEECLIPRQAWTGYRLLGSTGSGKTSLVNLLPRFHEYTGGRILLDGVELKDYSRAYLRKQIGIVEQEPFLFSRSIRENIMYGVGRDVPTGGSGTRRESRRRA